MATKNFLHCTASFLALSVFLLSFAAAPVAQAQTPLQPTQVAVFDANNKKVGDVVGAVIGVTTLAFQVGQQVAVLNVKANGFEGVQQIGFQSADCTGTPFFLLGGAPAPPTMSVLGLAALLNPSNFATPGQTIFVPVSPPTIQQVAISSQVSFQPFPACTPTFGTTFNAVQAQSTGVDLSTHFLGPFTLRATSNVLLGF